jgi:AcrR family transcriptional regulator
MSLHMAAANTPTESKGKPRDADATRARILDAALDEFAERGLAGARVDRIAERADANKRLIYLYFGNKDELFDAVIARHLATLTEVIPFRADDLAEYAGELFDQTLANPKALRLTAWRNFERALPAPSETKSYRHKLKEIKAAQKAGTINSSYAPEDVLALVLAMVRSWLSGSPALKALAKGDPMSPARLRRNREALVEAVRRAFVPAAD